MIERPAKEPEDSFPLSPGGDRRRFLWSLAAGAAAALPVVVSAAPRLEPTPEDDWGPFYPPVWSGEIDADLTRFAGGRAEGRPLRLTGRVRDRDGGGVQGAVVEIWQTDARGHYRHPGVPEPLRDPGFQGFGRTTTDGRGYYAFRTVLPGRYGTRPPHIHLRVAASGRPEFVTQVYFRGDNREGGRGNVVPPGRERLSVDLWRGGGDAVARFDVVLP